MRLLEIPILPGMVRQSLVTLNPSKGAKLFKPGEKLTISCPDLKLTFTTDVTVSTVRIRDRSNFGKIFKAYNPGEDDVMVLKEKSSGKWVLTFQKRPKGHANSIKQIKKAYK